jgi:hypothetical protein
LWHRLLFWLHLFWLWLRRLLRGFLALHLWLCWLLKLYFIWLRLCGLHDN